MSKPVVWWMVPVVPDPKSDRDYDYIPADEAAAMVRPELRESLRDGVTKLAMRELAVELVSLPITEWGREQAMTVAQVIAASRIGGSDSTMAKAIWRAENEEGWPELERQVQRWLQALNWVLFH